jgi:KaiC/GvpD/RAD55 family RecA-like ATPase
MLMETVKTFVRGFDREVLAGGFPAGSVVLLRGPSGTMKSSLAYYILYQNALKGVPGLYVTLEQSAGSLLEHIAGLGLRATEVSEALPILDLSRGREHLEGLVAKIAEMRGAKGAAPVDLLGVLKDKILDLQRATKARLVAVDSWDALESLLEFDDRRGETFRFFAWLRSTGLTSLLISEVYPAGLDAGFEEEFLADGVVRLTMERTTEISFQRRIQCVKLRSADHRAEPYTLLFQDGRFEVARAIG